MSFIKNNSGELLGNVELVNGKWNAVAYRMVNGLVDRVALSGFNHEEFARAWVLENAN